MASGTVGVGKSPPVMGHRERTAIEELSRIAGEASDLTEALTLMLDSVSDVLGADTAYICVVDEDTGKLEAVAFGGVIADLSRDASGTETGRALTAMVAKAGQPRIVEDTAADPLCSAAEVERRQLRSYAGTPLKSRGREFGVLSLFGAQPGQFTSGDLDLLSTVAGQLGVAIENCLLHEKLVGSQFRLRERVKELSILYDVSREALSTPDVGTFLSFVARGLPASMQHQSAVAIICCSMGGRRHLAWSENVDEATAERLCIVPGEGALGAELVQRGVVIEYDISMADPLWAEAAMKSILAVPVAVNGEIVGSLAVYYLNDRWRFLQEETHLLRGISEQVAQYLSRDAVERENMRHVQEVSTLFRVSKALASVVDVEGLLPAIEDTLGESLQPADAGALLLYDDATEMLLVSSAFGYELASLQRIALHIGESISGKVFESGEPRVWASPEESARAMANMTPYNRAQFMQASGGLDSPTSAVGVPLLYRDEKMGVLTLETFRGEPRLSATNLPFLQALAELIVINVNQIRLLQEAEQERAEDEADRFKSELIAALAHDMRTPLTSIQGYASALLLEDVEWDEEARTRQLEIIEEEATELQTMVQDLLESSIVDAGLMTVDKEPVLMPRLVEELVEEMTRRTAKHRFVVSFPSDFPIVDADRRRLEQVLRNLLDNALKYSPDGGLVVVRGQVAAGEVILSVADNGIGIAPEHLNRLFEKYFRVKSPIGEKVRGTGLGLPVSRTIVQSHGGRIWAESEVAKGTTIYFTLPCSESNDSKGD